MKNRKMISKNEQWAYSLRTKTIVSLAVFVLLGVYANAYPSPLIGVKEAASLAVQTLEVLGTVVDENGQPVPGADVVEKNTTNGTSTDFDGKFKLKLEKAGTTLVISYMGYESLEIKASENMVAQLSLDTRGLDEVVVTGYGTQMKSQITGAISSIKSEDIANNPNSNLGSGLQGKVSGLNVIMPSGTPGAGLMVSVRGNANPLYVVDGIPFLGDSTSQISTSFDGQGETVGSGQTISSVADINPNDIESIEVLKDASATAIYGSRAANGVILITTKRGKEGKSVISINTYGGVQFPARKIPFLNAGQFVDLINEARANDYAVYQRDNKAFGDGFDPSILTDPLKGFDRKGVDTNWLNEILKPTPILNTEISFKGGSDKTKHYLSLGYFDQQGIVIESFYKRYNLRFNIDHKVNDRFSVGANLSGTFSNNRRSLNDNTFSGVVTNALGASPFMPPREANGKYANYNDYQTSWNDNAVLEAEEKKIYTRVYRFLGSVFANYEFIPGLSLRTSVSTDYSQIKDNFYASSLTYNGNPVGGVVQDGSNTGLTWLNENTLAYTTKINKHDINTLLGASAQHTGYESYFASGQQLPSQGITNLSGVTNITKGTSLGTGFRLLSYFGRVNYGYDEKYLLTATMRTDGSSRFSSNNRFGFFPSFAAAWRLTKEDFFPIKSFINDLKFRVSYGLTGDQEIGNFQNRTFYSAGNYNGVGGVRLRNIADPSLTWQRNTAFNAGMDFSFFNGKVSGSAEFFDSDKMGLLFEDAVPGTTGFNTSTRNSGDVNNRGFEASISVLALKTKNFSWDMNFNYTYVKNTITRLDTDNRLINAYRDLPNTHIVKVGQALGTLWGVKYLGVDTQTGDPKYEDKNGDGKIDGDDSQILGQAIPKGFGGWLNNLNYKGFGLSFFFRFSYGNKVYNLIRSEYDNLGYSNGNYDPSNDAYQVYANNSNYVNDRWRKPGDNAEYPRASFINQNTMQNSSQFVEDGSFVRLQNVTFSYTFKNILEKSVNLKLYVEGQNLFVFTNYKGFDPEVSSTGGLNLTTAGIDYAAYPRAQTVLMGLNLSF